MPCDHNIGSSVFMTTFFIRFACLACGVRWRRDLKQADLCLAENGDTRHRTNRADDSFQPFPSICLGIPKYPFRTSAPSPSYRMNANVCLRANPEFETLERADKFLYVPTIGFYSPFNAAPGSRYRAAFEANSHISHL